MKNKDGTTRTYLQLVESRRVDGMPRQIVLMTLGRMDTDEGRERIRKITSILLNSSDEFRLLDPGKDLHARDTKELGPLLIFRRLWQELGFDGIINDEMDKTGAEFEVASAIFNMVLNRLSHPCSKKQLELWGEDVSGVESYELHQYYRAMDYLISHKDAIELGVFSRMRDLFHQAVDIVLFDTTTLIYFGDGDKGEELLANGFSKARRGDLKQVVVGILMSKEGIPLGHEVFKGNMNDVSCFEQIIGKVSEKFQLGKVIFVGDRGMISSQNLIYLKKNHYDYILGYRMRTISKEARANVLSKADLRKLKNSKLQFKEVEHNGSRLIVCYNEQRAEKDKEHRENLLEKLREKIRSGKVKNLISNPFYRRFVSIRADKPRLDEQKITQDELYDGIFVITTSTDLSCVQVVERYKDLWQVEMAFRQLKSELEVGPVFHWKDRRIRAHIMICFLALILRTSFYKLLKEQQQEISYDKVLWSLKSLRAVELKVQGEAVTIRTELKPMALLAFKALNMKAPNRVLSSSNNFSGVVVRRKDQEDNPSISTC
jgi:transposase